MQIDYKINDRFDFSIFVPVIILFLFGLSAIYSATQNTIIEKINFQKQFISLLVALIAFFVVLSLPTKIFKITAIPIYASTIFALILVLLIGKSAGGAKSWIMIGGFGFQPSEFAKISTILALAYYLSNQSTNIDTVKGVGFALAIGIFPVLLILMEPDLGSSFVFLGMILILLFWKGISLFGLFVVLSPVLVSVSSLFGTYYLICSLLIIVAILILFHKDIFISGILFAINIASGFFVDNFYSILSPHQQKRIQSFINPEADPLGSGYNAIQAKVAIGSGGLFGKGYLSGNQTQLQFIPEQWTDFIYCVIGEEFGFVGSMLIISIFLFLFLRILRIASSAKDEFLSLVIIGILSVYFIHFVINIGMTIGILPVIGIPLPFVSYGGSSLLVNMIMLAIIMNVYKTRKNYT